jgi:hypothetical protein
MTQTPSSKTSSVGRFRDELVTGELLEIANV